MGFTPSTGEHHDDVWSLDLTDDAAVWAELDPGGDPTDPDRADRHQADTTAPPTGS